MTAEELAGVIAGALAQVSVIRSVEVLTPDEPTVVAIETEDGREFFAEVEPA